MGIGPFNLPGDGFGDRELFIGQRGFPNPLLAEINIMQCRQQREMGRFKKTGQGYQMHPIEMVDRFHPVLDLRLVLGVDAYLAVPCPDLPGVP